MLTMKRKGVLEHVYKFQKKRAKLERDATHDKILNIMHGISPDNLELSEVLRHNYDTYEEIELTFKEKLKFSHGSSLLSEMTSESYWNKDRCRVSNMLKEVKEMGSVTNCNFFIKAEVDNRGVLVSYFGRQSTHFAELLSTFMKKIQSRYLSNFGEEKHIGMSFSFFISFV